MPRTTTTRPSSTTRTSLHHWIERSFGRVAISSTMVTHTNGGSWYMRLEDACGGGLLNDLTFCDENQTERLPLTPRLARLLFAGPQRGRWRIYRIDVPSTGREHPKSLRPMSRVVFALSCMEVVPRPRFVTVPFS